MTYCNITKIRLLTGLSSENIGDAKLRDLRDEVAIPKLNEDVNTIITDEQVDYISTDKENNIDGSNKTFYAKELDNEYAFIGDFNNDGEVDDSDVEAYRVDRDVREDLSVTLEDHEEGKLTIEKSNGDAVETGDIYITYSVAPLDEKTPSKLIEVACAQLTGAFGYTNIDRKNFDNFSIGAVSVDNSNDNSSEQMQDYMKTVAQIGQRRLIRSGENHNDIENVFQRGIGPNAGPGQG